jgi:hypothetical protein
MPIHWNRWRMQWGIVKRYASWLWLVIMLLVLIHLFARTSIFTLTATSEIVRFRVSNAMGLGNNKVPTIVKLHGIQLAVNSKRGNALANSCDFDSLQLTSNTEVIAIRKGQGLLKLQIAEVEPTNPPILVPKDTGDASVTEHKKLEKGDTLTLSSCSGIKADEPFSDASLVVPFEGVIAVGSWIKNLTPALLLSGVIQVIEKSPLPFFGLDDRIIIQETALTRGDMVEWPCSSTDPDCKSKLPIILYIGKDDAIGVTAYLAKSFFQPVHISRPGSEGYNIEVSILKRILSDPLINFLVLILGLFLGLYEIRELLIRAIRNRSRWRRD